MAARPLARPAMIGMMGGGTHANLKIAAALKAAVEGAVDANVRAVKACAEGETLVVDGTLPETESLETDFAALGASFEDAKPCIALLRLKGCERFATIEHWAMISYTPDNAPVKARMLNASSHKPLQIEFKDFKFVEYQVTMKDEVTLAQFLEATKELTETERRAAMTQQERDLADVKKATAKEQASAPKMLAGLVALRIKAHDSFNDAVKTLLAEEGKAVLGRLAGDKNEELSGEVLSDITSPSALKGKLPAEEPSYVIWKAAPTRLLLISWLPEFTPVKLRMKCSTFKASVIDLVKELAPEIEDIRTTEITDQDDITDELAEERAPKGESAGGTGGYDGSPKAAPKWKPPAGGFALPGMGPPGGMKMPGM